MSKGEDFGHQEGGEMKRMLKEMKAKMQGKLEAAETKYNFDFQAGKPAQCSDISHLEWIEMPRDVFQDQNRRQN